MRQLPRWLTAWNAAGHTDALAGRVWTRLLPDEAAYLRFAGPDDVTWRVGQRGHRLSRTRSGGRRTSREFYDELRRGPFVDELTLDVALPRHGGARPGPGRGDRHARGRLSATDIIGHTYGPDSQEIMDQLLRLDRMLGRLFDAAEAQAGRDRVAFGLSADHGSMPLVEVLKARGLDAKRRDSPAEIANAVRQALAARFPSAGELVKPATCRSLPGPGRDRPPGPVARGRVRRS